MVVHLLVHADDDGDSSRVRYRDDPYILIAIQLEERDLLLAHSEYEAYRRNVPMLLPFLKARSASREAVASRSS